MDTYSCIVIGTQESLDVLYIKDVEITEKERGILTKINGECNESVDLSEEEHEILEVYWSKSKEKGNNNIQGGKKVSYVYTYAIIL